MADGSGESAVLLMITWENRGKFMKISRFTDKIIVLKIILICSYLYMDMTKAKNILIF
ncbi:MAG: hypothetical protein NTX61_13980 [Bacteroidetes bacterium]|nr:hypothetical protein [Bacteroidota bacterium]